MSKAGRKNQLSTANNPQLPKKPGRPTGFRKEFIEQAFKLCKEGFKDTQLAEFFSISEATLNNWKHAFPKFLESIKAGRDIFDTEQVEKALGMRAVGYEYEEDCIERQSNGTVKVRKVKKKMPPDVTAQIFWLKNRSPKRWRDKQELEHSGEIRTSGVLVVPSKMSKEEWEKSQNKT